MGDNEFMLRQMKELTMLENRLVETCFTRCVYDFSSAAPVNKEMACVDSCFLKHWHSNTRIAERFTDITLEYQKTLMEDARRLQASGNLPTVQQQSGTGQQLEQLARQVAPSAPLVPSVGSSHGAQHNNG